jgi:Zn finger protein HypA/HybF involved in hydrogenase expression
MDRRPEGNEEEMQIPELGVGIIVSCTYEGICYNCDHTWTTNSPEMKCPKCPGLQGLNVGLRTSKILRIFLL